MGVPAVTSWPRRARAAIIAVRLTVWSSGIAGCGSSGLSGRDSPVGAVDEVDAGRIVEPGGEAGAASPRLSASQAGQLAAVQAYIRCCGPGPSSSTRPPRLVACGGDAPCIYEG